MPRGYSIIALHQPKTDSNIGGAYRAAYCYDVSAILVSGKRFKKYPTDTPATWKHIPLIHVDNIKSSIPYNCVPVAVEICDKAMPIFNFIHPERAMYIFGPEDGSVSQEILDTCTHKIFIPTKTCMNLASTVNVILYDRLLKQNR